MHARCVAHHLHRNCRWHEARPLQAAAREDLEVDAPLAGAVMMYDSKKFWAMDVVAGGCRGWFQQNFLRSRVRHEDLSTLRKRSV